MAIGPLSTQSRSKSSTTVVLGRHERHRRDDRLARLPAHGYGELGTLLVQPVFHVADSNVLPQCGRGDAGGDDA